MFIHKTLTAMLIAVLLFGNIIAQQSTVSTPKPPEISPELRKNAVELLRQTIKEIPNLKTEENRQYFTIETAYLLWKYDEKESRVMFERTMQEVKQSLAKTIEKHKEIAQKIKKESVNANANYGYYNAMNRPANSYVANRYSANATNTAYSKANSAIYYKDLDEHEVDFYDTGLTDEFRQIGSIHQNLIRSLIDLDVNLAYRFLTETVQMMPKGINAYRYGYYSNSLEREIILEMLENNEVDKAVEVARIIFNKNNSESFTNILTSIYEKDALKGNKLAEEVLQTLKLAPINSLNRDKLSGFFDNAVSFAKEQTPLLAEKSLRDLAKILGQSVLLDMNADYFYFYPPEYAKKIKDYAPREALKILQKSNQMKKSNSPSYANKVGNSASAAYSVMVAANTAANAARTAANAANMAANKSTKNTKNTKPKIATTPSETKLGEIPIEIEATDTIAELRQKLIIGKFTADEREKTIKLTKQYAFANNYWGYARPERFISVVTELARFSIISTDKEISDALMQESEIYVRPETKNMLDYGGKLILAGGYSRHHPDKSFALMESMASINEVIESAVKLGVFIDVESTFISDDEVSASFFLGDVRLGRDILQTEELQLFIQNLAKSDFQRTKGLADKFTRNEVKMTAKLLILESLIGERRDLMRDYDY